MVKAKTLCMSKENIQRIDKDLKNNVMTPRLLARITGFAAGISMAIMSYEENEESWAKAVLVQNCKIIGETTGSKVLDEPWVIQHGEDVFIATVKSYSFTNGNINSYITY